MLLIINNDFEISNICIAISKKNSQADYKIALLYIKYILEDIIMRIFYTIIEDSVVTYFLCDILFVSKIYRKESAIDYAKVHITPNL